MIWLNETCPPTVEFTSHGQINRVELIDLTRVPERIEEIDRMLFDAGLLVLGATTKQLRKEADAAIMDARVKLEKLRKQLTYHPVSAERTP